MIGIRQSISLVIISLFLSGFSVRNNDSLGVIIAKQRAVLQGRTAFVVEPDQTIQVKGDFLIESEAVIDIQGTLVVEGAMIVSGELQLTITGNGKLLVKGGVVNKTGALKNIAVLDNGQFLINGTFETNENIHIITEKTGIIRADKIITMNAVHLSGTRNLVASNCDCSGVSENKELNICQILALARI